MYGAGAGLIMPPPHVVIFSNYVFDMSLLSIDRWLIYEVDNKTFKLKTQNALMFESNKNVEKRKEVILKEKKSQYINK